MVSVLLYILTPQPDALLKSMSTEVFYLLHRVYITLYISAPSTSRGNFTTHNRSFFFISNTVLSLYWSTNWMKLILTIIFIHQIWSHMFLLPQIYKWNVYMDLWLPVGTHTFYCNIYISIFFLKYKKKITVYNSQGIYIVGFTHSLLYTGFGQMDTHERNGCIVA